MTAALRRSFSSLEIPNYRRYFAGQLVSLSGNWMQIVAEMWLILQLTGSGVAVGVTSALQFLPMLLFAPWGGVLADRWPKRSLLIVTQTAMIAPAVALWALTATGAVAPWMVFALVFARGAVNSIDNPARQSFAIEMVGADRVVNAVGLNSVLIHCARIAGPAGAGLMIATVGIAPCFLVNAATFAAMIVALRGMDPEALFAASREPLEDTKEGGVRAALRYVRGQPQLLIPLAMMALVGTLAFNFQVLLPLLGRFTFDGGAEAYTALAMAMAVGSVAGALFTSSRGKVSNRLIVGAAGAFGIFALLAAAAPSLTVAVALLIPLGAASVTFAAGVNSSLQLSAAPAMRGRVMALYSVVFLGSTPIGGPIVGLLSELTGPRAGLVLGGAAALTAAIAGTRAFAASPGLGRWRRWGLRARWPVAVQARSAQQAHRLERRGGLDVEANPVAVLDRGDGALAAAPCQRDPDRVTGADRRDLRPHPAGTAHEQGEGADRPQPQEGDPGRALGRQAGRRSRAGQHARDRIRGPRRAAEVDARDRGCDPPDAGDDQRGRIAVLARDDQAHRTEHRGDSRDEQDGHPQQVGEQHLAPQQRRGSPAASLERPRRSSTKPSVPETTTST
jgi:MFS family permease